MRTALEKCRLEMTFHDSARMRKPLRTYLSLFLHGKVDISLDRGAEYPLGSGGGVVALIPWPDWVPEQS